MRGKAATFADLSGGVNLIDSPYHLKESEARNARNMVGSLRGKARKRDGAQTFVSPSIALDSLFAMQSPSPFLIGAGEGSIIRINPAGAIAGLAAGLASASRWEFAQAPANGGQGPLWGMNGVDTPKQWDGVAGALSDWTAATGTLPNGRYLVYASNRLFVAGMSSYGSLSDAASAIVFSNLANPRDWPAENVVEFDPRDGDVITGLGTIGPYLLIFKSNKAWIVYDLDTGANRKLGEGVGCVSHRSIVESAHGTFFLSEDQGVMLTDGSHTKRVGERIQPLLDALQPAQRQAATGVVFGDHYYLSISTTGSYNDITLDYDIRADAWWIHTLAAQDWAVWEPASGPALYAAKAGEHKVHRPFVAGVTQDDGVNYRAFWESPEHTFGDPVRKKRVELIHLDGRGRVDVSVGRDYAATEESVGNRDFLTSTGLIDIGDVRILTPGVARAWSLVISNETDEAMELDSYTFSLKPRTD